MTDACIRIRDVLLERRGVPQSADTEVSAHLGACSDCAGFARRAAAIAHSLASLPRRPAPRELDGVAVRALEAGYRQDRAVHALRTLSRTPVPDELAGLALDLDPQAAKAPSVLDRLVEEDLRSLGAGLSRRFARKLERRRAPPVLRERLELPGRALAGSIGARRARLAAAAAALLLLGGGLWLFRAGAGNDDVEQYFLVQRETSLEAMDPIARSLLSGLSGGLVGEEQR